MSKKITKALIGGNWKCNGTVAQIKSMIEVLNKAGHSSLILQLNWQKILQNLYLYLLGPFSANSEVVIAAPSIHLGTLLQNFRPDIATSAEVTYNFKLDLFNYVNISIKPGFLLFQ